MRRYLKKIKAWNEAATESKINKWFLNLDLTKYDLLNFIYFNGEWLNRFDSSKTKDSVFHSADKKTRTVRMMCQRNFYLCSYDDNNEQFHCFNIPFKQKELVCCTCFQMPKIALMIYNKL